MYMLLEIRQTTMHVILHRKHSGATPMQIMGHQVVGSLDKGHEDVKMMYEKFFGGETVHIRRALKKELSSIKIRKLLSQIFKVMYYSTP